MSGFRDFPGAEEVQAWLQLASGVKSVDYDPLEFAGLQGGDCGMEGQFVDVQRRLQERLVGALTRFMFCWSSLECAADLLVPKSSQTGKIRKVCEYLKGSHRQLGEIPGYGDALQRLQLASQQALPSNALRSPVGNESFLSEAGIGVWRVYHLRNIFAHGSLEVPVQGGHEEVPELALLNISTEIVVYTLQMIIIERFGKHGLDVWWGNHQTISVKIDRLMWWIHVGGDRYLPDGFKFNELDMPHLAARGVVQR